VASSAIRINSDIPAIAIIGTTAVADAISVDAADSVNSRVVVEVARVATKVRARQSRR
jgi:hypothetical protein